MDRVVVISARHIEQMGLMDGLVVLSVRHTEQMRLMDRP